MQRRIDTETAIKSENGEVQCARRNEMAWRYMAGGRWEAEQGQRVSVVPAHRTSRYTVVGRWTVLVATVYFRYLQTYDCVESTNVKDADIKAARYIVPRPVHLLYV